MLAALGDACIAGGVNFDDAAAALGMIAAAGRAPPRALRRTIPLSDFERFNAKRSLFWIL